jgi:hypothetical protein
MANIPVKDTNPNGLHRRYFIRKYVGKRYIGNNFFGEPVYEPEFEDVDPNAEYFVMRLDVGGSDLKHIAACRVGIHAYADAIEPHLPELAKDLRERYPLLIIQP